MYQHCQNIRHELKHYHLCFFKLRLRSLTNHSACQRVLSWRIKPLLF